MKRTAAALALVMLLLVFTVGIEVVRITVADPYIPPEEAPSGCRIYSNGTYTVENLRQDGNVYTFTDDVDGSIVIERDNIVLDGAGYTLRGSGSSFGIWLQDRTNVTVKNLNITNFGQGIRFSHYAPDWHTGQTNPIYTTNCTIQACNVTNNNSGISFYLGTSGCNILDNYVANNTNGMTIGGSGNTLRNNSIDNNQYGFWDQDDGDNDVDDSNTVNGKLIIYWVNQNNMTVPDNAGLVILKKCSGIKVQNLDLRGHGIGLTLYYTSNSTIIGNSICDNYWRGISVWWSNNNSIIGNQVTKNANDGIEEYESHSNTISHNLINENRGSGIYDRYLISNDVISSNQIIANQGYGIFGDSTNCTITDNFIFENAISGISVDSNCIVARNNITSNGPKTSAFTGAGLSFRNNCTILDNYVSKNNRGIWTYDGEGNTITENTIAYNNNEGIRFQGPADNNLIYHNNFIENNNHGTQAYVNTPNTWDNGIEGNYWSDHKSEDQKTDNSTVGNMPYFISDKNQDNHPFLTPLEFATLELPSIQPPRPADPTIAINTETKNQTDIPAVKIAFTVALIIAGIALLVFFKKRSH
jgi:parallel beta-helix repeat protein